MANYKSIEVKDSKDQAFDYLYSQKALIISESLDGLPPCEILESLGPVWEEILDDHASMYFITGKIMNDHYNLHDENQFPRDLGFVCVPSCHVKDEKRFRGKRFNDIVNFHLNWETEMAGLEIINVTEPNDEAFDLLYNQSASTIEGLFTEYIPVMMNSMRSEFKVKFKEKVRVYQITGKAMNKHYSLTGDNAYKDDLNIVAIPLCDIEDIGTWVLGRFHYDARWFDDIVDNNARREGYEEA